MSKTIQMAKINEDGIWKVYLRDGMYIIYHEFYDGKWHKKQFESGRQFDTMAEALHELANYIENEKFIRRLASRFSHT